MQSHYLNQCWNIVNWTLRNKFQWRCKQISYIFIQENEFECIVREMAAILSRPQCVNALTVSDVENVPVLEWNSFNSWSSKWPSWTLPQDQGKCPYVPVKIPTIVVPVIPKSRQHVCFVRRRIQMTDVEFVKIISIWCLSVQFGRRSRKAIREDCSTTTFIMFISCFPAGLSVINS